MARAAKLDLRAFQHELAARLAAKTAQQVEQSRLGLACGGKQWLIRLADAGEVIAVPAMATVPLTKAWYLGIANIRGNLYGVIDFAGFLEQRAEVAGGAHRAALGDVQGGVLAGPSAQARMVLFGPRVGELRAGLVVSRVLGLSNLAELTSGDPPADAPTWYGLSWTDKNGGVWQEIDLALLAQDAGFLQVGL